MNKVGSEYIKNLSPMYLGPVVEKDIFGKGSLVSKNFENYWQYGKKFEELDHIKNRSKWIKFRYYGYSKKSGDRHQLGTKSNVVKYELNGKKYLIKRTKAFKELKKLVDSGKNILILDFDIFEHVLKEVTKK